MKSDFKTPQRNESYYDLFEDYDLIEASFAQQYGIRLRYEDNMPWGEFSSLLAALNETTPLGRIVSIRAETNKDVLKNFTPEQKRIRHEWRNRQAQKVSKEEFDLAMNGFSEMFKGIGKQNKGE